MLPQESKYGDLMQKSLPALMFWGTSHWNQCIFYIPFFSEFFSSISCCYNPGLHKVRSYLPRKVRKKRRVETPSKIIKLIYYYTHITLSSYPNFRFDRTIIHNNTSILLQDHYSGLILLIGIATKHNEPNMIWIQTRHGQLPSQEHVDGLFMQRNRHWVDLNFKILKYTVPYREAGHLSSSS